MASPRADPGVDFIQELQIQSVGASVEYGNVQGAVVNVITKSGSNLFQSESAYYWQAASAHEPAGPAACTRAANRTADTSAQSTVTSPPVSADPSSAIGCGSSPDTSVCAIPTVSRAPIRTFRGNTSRTRSSGSSPGAWLRAGSWCRAFTTSSGPTPKHRRRRSHSWRPRRLDASVPAINLGHLTHTASANTVWDVRAGWFRFTQDTSPTSGDPTIPNRIDQPENVWSGGPQQIGEVRQIRATVKATLSHYRAGLARRGSRVENRRASRSGRASRGRRPSDRHELCLHERRVDADDASRSPPIRVADSSPPLRS